MVKMRKSMCQLISNNSLASMGWGRRWSTNKSSNLGA